MLQNCTHTPQTCPSFVPILFLLSKFRTLHGTNMEECLLHNGRMVVCKRVPLVQNGSVRFVAAIENKMMSILL
jgi:hypothetical protein